MLGVLYTLIFVVGIVLGFIICASALEVLYYSGEVDVSEEKLEFLYIILKKNLIIEILYNLDVY